MAITWKAISRDRFCAMMEIVMPAIMNETGFLVGEPSDHRDDGTSSYQAFKVLLDAYYEASAPLTVVEFDQVTPHSIDPTAFASTSQNVLATNVTDLPPFVRLCADTFSGAEHEGVRLPGRLLYWLEAVDKQGTTFVIWSGDAYSAARETAVLYCREENVRLIDMVEHQEATLRKLAPRDPG